MSNENDDSDNSENKIITIGKNKLREIVAPTTAAKTPLSTLFLENEHTNHRGLLADFDDVTGIDRDISVVRTGFQTNGTPMKVSSPPPTLGQHNEDLLRELGYDDDAINMFREKGVI